MTSISIECKSVKTLTITDAMDQQMTESIAHNKPKAGMRSCSGFFLFTIVLSNKFLGIAIEIPFFFEFDSSIRRVNILETDFLLKRGII
jgi:hypothetical protein